MHAVPVPAHTTNDVVVWLPEQSVMFTGDLLCVGGTPFVPMGSVSGSLRALEWLRGFDARTLSSTQPHRARPLTCVPPLWMWSRWRAGRCAALPEGKAQTPKSRRPRSVAN
ncbi:MAG: MBL fold metallo-hydrolase [Chloroflexi bacterium]|nr:MBL fold metallo-hydrolase [Chloroflexota bacterium]